MKSGKNSLNCCMSNWILIIKDITQTLFFISTGAVAVLTFLKAKKTLLQPVRTEVFKEQVKLFIEILRVFRGKSEIELRQDAGLELHFVANTTMMYDNFAKNFYDVNIDEETRPYAYSKCPVCVVPATSLMLVNEHIQKEDTNPIITPDPRARAAIWGGYSHEDLRMPKQLIDYERTLGEFIESPFVPRKLAELIDEYKTLIHVDAMRLRDVLCEAAKQMPQKYQTADALSKASFSWVKNDFNSKISQLKQKAEEISEYIRVYLGTENILQ